MIHERIGWNTHAMALSMRGPRNGIDPATAAIIVREFKSCPECGGDINPTASDGLREDRDVIWEREAQNSTCHTCSHCDTKLRIFVEEKAFGIISDSQVPENAEDSTTLHFIPIEGADAHLRVNTFQMNVSKEPPNTPPSEERDPTPA